MLTKSVSNYFILLTISNVTIDSTTLIITYDDNQNSEETGMNRLVVMLS